MCLNQLQMITHAAMMYRTAKGKNPKSLKDLKNLWAPGEFNKGVLRCPCDGTLSLSEDGITGRCSHHGTASFLTPALEIPLDKVTDTEAKLYKEFLKDYNEYWEKVFDPIAMRMQITKEGSCRVETIVLPLINNSIYTSLASAFKGATVDLDAKPVLPESIFSLKMKFDNSALKKELEKAEFGEVEKEIVEELGISKEDAKKLNPVPLMTKGFGSTIGVHIFDNNPRMNDNWPLAFASLLANPEVSAGFLGPELLAAFCIDSRLSLR